MRSQAIFGRDQKDAIVLADPARSLMRFQTGIWSFEAKSFLSWPSLGAFVRMQI